MPSVTTWNRLEPYPYSDDLSLSLSAQLRDPLWLLARQWQMGEFQGEDNGSPIWVEIGETKDGVNVGVPYYYLTRYRAGTETYAYSPDSKPLESQVEAEPYDSTNITLRVESGLHFLKLLKDLSKRYREPYLEIAGLSAKYPGECDPETSRYVSALAGRAIDGKQLYERTESGLGIEEVNAEDMDTLQSAVMKWRDIYARLFEPKPHSSWAGDRLEYNFAVAAPLPLLNENGEPLKNETVLCAAEYQGGHLDWPAFSIRVGESHGAIAPAQVPAAWFEGPPTPVTYPGMPVPRYWQFEDGQVNFGAIDAAANDLGRALLIDFSLMYGNDFFLVPLELPVGSLCRIKHLSVVNTFGESHEVKPAGETGGKWRMFALTAEGDQIDTNFLFLPPTLFTGSEGQLVEEVVFARDEMANLVWAIERQFTNQANHLIKRHEKWAQRSKNATSVEPKSVEGQEVAYYRLISEVPDYWYPMELVPGNGGTLKLRIYNPERSPHGLLLREKEEFELYEEEVPRFGISVRRAYQHARWMDGSHHVWIGRRKEVGRGEASSGLRFDFPDVT